MMYVYSCTWTHLKCDFVLQKQFLQTSTLLTYYSQVNLKVSFMLKQVYLVVVFFRSDAIGPTLQDFILSSVVCFTLQSSS